MKKIGIIVAIVFCSIQLIAQEKKPNVILIISDQHAGKIMTQRGYPHITTPGIDSLAKNGVTFTRAYVAYPVCTASRASMITGVMPSKSSKNLTDYASIGSIMKAGGYETGYFGKWHVANSKMDKTEDWHGFDQYKDMRNDTRIKELSTEFISAKREKPFFMISSFLNPHDCCELARNMSGMNDNYHDGVVEENAKLEMTPELPENFLIPENEPEGFYVRRTPDSTNHTMFRKHPVKYWDETKWRQYMYGYDRLVEKVDQHMLDIFNHLKQEGQLANTIIIYTSDHGDGHAAHEWNQKMTFYEESVNVPFIISWKDQVVSDVIDKKTLVNTGLDIFPTICEMTGVTYPKELLGADLGTPLQKENETAAVKRAFVVSEINQLSLNDEPGLIGRMVVTDRYKYFLFDGGENREQLFDLEKDPGEMNPVTNEKKYIKILNSHRKMLKTWIDETEDDFSKVNIPN